MNWHELFQGTIKDQLNEVRDRARLKFNRTGTLLEISVSDAKTRFRGRLTPEVLNSLEFVRDPLWAVSVLQPDGKHKSYPADMSHCLFTGMELLDDVWQTAVAKLLVDVVLTEHRALTPAGGI